jgi:hypothetical protein
MFGQGEARFAHESYRCHSKKVRRSGGVGGWVQDGYWLTAAPHRETRRPNESRSFPSRYAHNYDGCTLASAQYCSVFGNILTGDILERIESLPCRVLATTVAESQQGFPVGCPLQHEKYRDGSEGTLGEVEGSTTEEGGVTIAQLLTGFLGRSRSIGSKTPVKNPRGYPWVRT